MALTLRLNGRAAQNLITSAWFNDFYNLFTGNMTDQIVTFQTDLLLKAIGAAPAAPTLALATGTALGIGAYKYVVTLVDANGGESLPSASANITTTSGNQDVSLTAIPTGPTGTSKRKIYRTAVGGTSFLLLTTLNDNTTTTFADSTADGSLGVAAPTHPSFGGALTLQDSSANQTLLLGNDGVVTGGLGLKAVGPLPAAPGVALHAGSGLGIGAYQYVVTFISSYGNAYGESGQSSAASITTTTGNQQVSLSGIPTGPAGTLQRNIYRTAVGGSVFKYLTTITDNTTTTYLDSTADGSLISSSPPVHPSYGGTLRVYDSSNNTIFGIYGDGVVVFNKALSSSNQLMDMEQGYGLYSDNTGSSGGTTRMWWDAPNNGEIHLGPRTSANYLAALAIRANTITLDFAGGNPLLTIGGYWIESGGLYFGVKDSSGGKLFEGKAGGNFIIGGTTYYTAQSTYNTSASGSFDSFDVGECYETDQNYPAGTVVAINPALGQMVKCTTDGSPLAHVLVNQSAFSIGEPDPTNHIQPVALAGRVLANVNSPTTIAAGQLVCADSNGGVRPLAVGEWNHVVGVAIGPNASGQVPLILRPMYAKG